jgi:hypothetical protein
VERYREARPTQTPKGDQSLADQPESLQTFKGEQNKDEYGGEAPLLHKQRHGARYVCNTEIGNLSNKNCIAFSNVRIDAAVSAEVLRAISPLAIEADRGSRASRCGAAAAERTRPGTSAL